MTGEPSALDVPRHVLDYLGEQATLTVATASPAGLPHAATVTYVSDGVTLYFWMRPDTTTARHIDANPVVAFTVDAYAADWRTTKGIQGSGESEVVLDPSELRRIVGLYAEKFPAVEDARVGNLSFFRVVPTQLHFIDNERDHPEAGGQAEQAIGIAYHRSVAFSVFRGLPAQEVATLAARLDTVRVDAGEVVVRQGAPADKFFVIVHGEVDVVREDCGQQRTVASLADGQFFGEIAILRDIPRTATVRATRPTTMLTMDRDTFRRLVAQSLGTTQDIDELIQGRLDELRTGT